MDSVRQQKVSRLLQNEIGSIFQRDGFSLFKENAMVTVTKVNISKDLLSAKVYISLFATSDKEELLKKIQNKTSEIRYMLGKIIRHQLKAVPELSFFEDDSLDYIENIDKLLE